MLQEAEVLESPTVQLSQQFHMIRMSLLNYRILLEDFRKTIRFIRTNSNHQMAPNETKIVTLNSVFYSSIIKADNANLVFSNAVFTDCRVEFSGKAPTDGQTIAPEIKEQLRFDGECSLIDQEILRLQAGVTDRTERIKDVMSIVRKFVILPAGPLNFYV
jgi:hypothetical protein